MTTSSTITAYEDMRTVSERAINSERGIRMKFPSRGAAVHFRQRLYKFRTLDREASKRVYDKGENAWGTSPYDGLFCTISEKDEEGNYFVLIQKRSAGAMEIEEL